VSIHLKGCKELHPAGDVCRNWQGSPLIVQPDGKVRAYARASSYGDPLDDKGNLIAWSQANAMRGLLLDSTLHRDFLEADDGWSTPEAKKATRAVIDRAAILGGSETKANTGTDLHRWSEALDRGESLADLPVEFGPDLDAYAYTTGEMKHLAIERFSVLDSIHVAGTPDRITEHEGDTYIFDLKTGKVDYPHKMAVQLAIYSRSQFYLQDDDGTAIRTHLPLVNLDWALILHLPAGSGTAKLYRINIAAGWEAINNEIPLVKTWRSRKDLLEPA